MGCVVGMSLVQILWYLKEKGGEEGVYYTLKFKAEFLFSFFRS